MNTMDIKTVADLEAFLKTHGFRQDPDNEEDRDISEFRHITEHERIKDENWARYQYLRYKGAEINHHRLWDDIERSDVWEVLIKHDKSFIGAAVNPGEGKILLFFFDAYEDNPLMTKLEQLVRPIDFKQRLDRILNAYLIWLGDVDLFNEKELEEKIDEIYALAEKYDLKWRSGIHPRLRWIEEEEEA
ncbi:MAG: hypothetical protein ACFFFG_01555 [Candidatus Thorarchaeota archaeon]